MAGHRIGDFVSKIEAADEFLKTVHFARIGVGVFGLKGKEDRPVADGIRRRLYEMPPHAGFNCNCDTFEFGDFTMEDRPLRDLQIYKLNLGLVKNGHFSACLFARKEEACAVVAETAFVDAVQAKSGRWKPLILSFSSDLSWPSLPGSETIHLGMQHHATSRERIEELSREDGKIVSLSQLENGSLFQMIEALTDIAFARPCWVSFDLNVLAAAQGGDKRSWATGLSLHKILQFFETLSTKTQWQGISIGPTEGLAPHDLTARSCVQMLTSSIHSYTFRKAVGHAHGE